MQITDIQITRMFDATSSKQRGPFDGDNVWLRSYPSAPSVYSVDACSIVEDTIWFLMRSYVAFLDILFREMVEVWYLL